jgi:Ca2+-transporting ATPase
MLRRPRPSGESIMTKGLKMTSGLVGLYMAIVLDALIALGHDHYGSTAIGSSIGLTAFGLMLVVAAYESRSVTLSAIVSETFDNPRVNWTAAAEVVLALMVTQMDFFNRLLGTVPLTAGQFGLAVAAAVLLFVLWEVAKLIVRRTEQEGPRKTPVPDSGPAAAAG